MQHPRIARGTIMKRREVLKSVLAGSAVLAAPRVGRADAQKVLKFVPQADLASFDPVWTTADITRNQDRKSVV